MQKAKEKTGIKEDMMADYRRVKEFSPKERMGREFYLKHGKYTRRNIEKHFGSWTDFKKAMGEIPKVTWNITKEEVAEVAYQLFEKHNKLTATIMDEEGYPQSTVIKVFGSFREMMEELNLPLEPTSYGRTLTDAEYVRELRRIEKKNRYVNSTLISRHSVIPRHSFMHRYGTIGEACLYAKVRHIGQNTVKHPTGEANQAIREVSELIKDDYYHTEIALDWLRNPETNQPMPVDGYFPRSNLIVEYHGPHHYNPNFWLNKSPSGLSFEEIQQRDKLKAQMTKDKGVRYLYIYDYERTNISLIMNERMV